MKSFSSDVTDHTYVLELTFGRCETIRAKTGFDFCQDNWHELFMELWQKPASRLDVLWLLVQEKQELPIIDDPDFYSDDDEEMPEKLTRKQSFESILKGQTLTDAQEAFWDEIGFFIQTLHQVSATVLDLMISEMKSVSDLQAKAATEMTKDPRRKKLVNQAIEQAKISALGQLEKLSGSTEGSLV